MLNVKMTSTSNIIISISTYNFINKGDYANY